MEPTQQHMATTTTRAITAAMAVTGPTTARATSQAISANYGPEMSYKAQQNDTSLSYAGELWRAVYVLITQSNLPIKEGTGTKLNTTSV